MEKLLATYTNVVYLATVEKKMLFLLGLGIYFLKLVFWCFKNLCLSFTFDFFPHFVFIVLTTVFCSSLFIKSSFDSEEWKEPLHMRS